MKKVNLIVVILLSILIFSCGNTENRDTDKSKQESEEELSEEVNPNESNTGFELLTFDKSIVSKLDGIKGDLLYGYKWKDKAGLNQLVFTMESKFVDMKVEGCEYCGNAYTYLKAYHFAGSETSYKLVRMVQDGNQKGCSNPPFNLEVDFYKKSISITDLNKNGYAEITFMYKMLCASELTPVPTKLMLLENGEKYAIRGDSYIPDYKMGGAKNIDPSFKNADKELKDYASKIWDKFCKPNPSLKSTSEKGITLNDLKNATFFGRKDINWSMDFKDKHIVFKNNIGEESYKVHYYSKEIITKISDNKIQIKAITDLDKGYIWTITIKKEACSDGESDISYDYSVNIKWEDANGVGCGRIK